MIPSLNGFCLESGACCVVTRYKPSGFFFYQFDIHENYLFLIVIYELILCLVWIPVNDIRGRPDNRVLWLINLISCTIYFVVALGYYSSFLIARPKSTGYLKNPIHRLTVNIII